MTTERRGGRPSNEQLIANRHRIALARLVRIVRNPKSSDAIAVQAATQIISLQPLAELEDRVERLEGRIVELESAGPTNEATP